MSRQKEKNATTDYRALDVRELHRSGLLTNWRGNWRWSRRGEVIASIGVEGSRERVQLRYQTRKAGGDSMKHDYPVTITWTSCHFGGERPWFLCPCCARRVAKLYGGNVFVCRHCLSLNYPCQQTSKRDRAMERAWELRRRLGCDAGPLDFPAEYVRRPKGMHRSTFARHIEKLTRIEAQAVASFVHTVSLINRRLERLPNSAKIPSP